MYKETIAKIVKQRRPFYEKLQRIADKKWRNDFTLAYLAGNLDLEDLLYIHELVIKLETMRLISCPVRPGKMKSRIYEYKIERT